MGRAWRDAVAMINANREVMLVISGVFFFLPSLAAVLLIPEMPAPTSDNPEEVERLLLEFYSANMPYIIVMGLIQAVGLLALLALLRDDRRPTVGDALKIGVTGVLPYIGTQLIVAFAFAVALLLLVALPAAAGIAALTVIFVTIAAVAFFYVMTRLSLTLPVIAIEKVFNPLHIIRRAWSLTKGHALQLFLFFMLLLVAFVVISIVAGLITGIPAALLGDGTSAQMISGVVSGLVSALGTMLFAAILAAVHRQLAGPSTGNLSQTFE